MESWWDFFASESNRATLSWLGAAIASLAVALWSAIKFFVSRKNKSTEAQPPVRHTKVHKIGIFGRDISISGGVSFGERRSTWLLLFAIFAVFAAFALYLALASGSGSSDPVTIVKRYTFNNEQETNFYLRAVNRFEEQQDADLAGGDLPVSALAGRWSSRWRRTGEGWFSGTATLTASGDEVLIDYSDRTGEYRIEARWIGPGVLAGRYQNLGIASDSTLWIGFVKSDSLIRGYWESGDWNFSRT